MFCRRPVSILLCLLIAPAYSVAGDSIEEHYAKSARAVHSYDVLLEIVLVSYPGAAKVGEANPPLPGETSQSMRDVFAVNQGRRVERCPDDPQNHQIAVKDWQAVQRDARALGASLSYVPGLDYFSYFNPSCEGFLLADLVTDEKAEIQRIEPDRETGCPGIEVTYPGFRGPIRFWVDPKHGYMPIKIETYLSKGKETGLFTRCEVSEFHELASTGIWVPLKGTETRFTPIGAAAGRATSGIMMTVDISKSSWNSVKSSDLFAASSIAKNDEQLGWSRSLTGPQLAAVELAESLKAAAHRPTGFRLIFLAANAAAVIVLIAVVIRRWRRARSIGSAA